MRSLPVSAASGRLPIVSARPATRARRATDADTVPHHVDDGGASVLHAIAERLERRGWRGHCFVSTDLHRPARLSGPRSRSGRSPRRGHVIGSHSASHPARFNALPFADMVSEWSRSRQILEDILGHGGRRRRRCLAATSRRPSRARRRSRASACCSRPSRSRASTQQWPTRADWPLHDPPGRPARRGAASRLCRLHGRGRWPGPAGTRRGSSNRCSDRRMSASSDWLLTPRASSRA